MPLKLNGDNIMNPDHDDYFGEQPTENEEFIPNVNKILKKELKKTKFQRFRMLRKAQKRP